MIKNYIDINRTAYNSLADEYNTKCFKNIKKQKQLLKKFVTLLKKNFDIPIKVLDVGCGIGANCRILEEEQIECTGIDNASEMIKYARRNSPRSRFIVSNFLDYKGKDKFQGIILGAFLNLFPEKDLEKLLLKTKQLLDNNSFVFIYTKLYNQNKEGLFLKEGYDSKIKRFIRLWKKEDFIKKLEKYFNIVYMGKGYGDKKWYMFVGQKG